MASDLVQVQEVYQILICRECKYAIWPHQSRSHFTGPHHRLNGTRAQQIQKEIQSWPDLIQDPQQFQVPVSVEQAIPELELHDGFQCQASVMNCHYICVKYQSIRRHVQNQHGISRFQRRGQPSQAQQAESHDRPLWRAVQCQRFFVQGPRSHFFEVSQADAIEQREDATSRAMELMQTAWQQALERDDRFIQEGQENEVNPWLKRTGWHEYLVGKDRLMLLDLIAEPGEDDPEEIHVIWRAMDQMIRHCQQTVGTRVGIFVRLEAIRTEKHQTRFYPLQPYMDAKQMGEYSRPWKQVIAFIARTQTNPLEGRPKYRLSEEQKRLWQKVIELAQEEGQREESPADSSDDEEGGDAGRLSGLPEACLWFCTTLLNQMIQKKEYESPLICGLALLGVKADGWKDANDYPPILSAMIKISRFMVIQIGYQSSPVEESDDEEEREERGGLEKAGEEEGEEKEEDEEERETASLKKDLDKLTSSKQKVHCLEWVTGFMDEFMVRGTKGPMQWMLDLRTYGLKIHYNSTAQGHVDWDGDRILYKDIQFTMDEFRGMVHGLVHDTRKLLVKEIMHVEREEQLPSIPWSQLRDDPHQTRTRWSFIQDERNPWPVDGKTWFTRRIEREERLKQQFVSTNRPEHPWKDGGVQRYSQQVMKFREQLLLCIHLCGGGPARGPEILSICHRNTTRGEQRNVFLDRGAVVVVARYHKGYSISGNVKIIHRYLPREVGELVVYYLWLVLPFHEMLEMMCWPKDEITSHMWPADSNGRKWSSERIRQILKRESQSRIGVALGIQAYRMVVIAISRRFLRQHAFGLDEDDEDGEYDEDDGQRENETIAQQSGHSAHVAGMIYARGIMEQTGEVHTMRERFRETSERWHTFLGFPHHGRGTKRAAPFEAKAQRGQRQRWRRLGRTDVVAVLKEMMGEPARFRGVQKTAIEAIMVGESPVVVVMGTGGGKSLLFMLPAWCERGGVSVVVVPLIALRQDMKERCERLRIGCVEWQAGRPPDDAQIVLVTPESAVGGDFRTFLNRMKAVQRLDRIVIDECHVMLNEQRGFRRRLQELGRLMEVGTQVVMLTATLPPTQEAELWSRMGVVAREVKMFRESTTRKNVRYRVQQMKAKKGQKSHQEMMRWIRQIVDRERQGKIVIYGRTISEVEELAGGLTCEAYHSQAEDKSGKLQRLKRGEQRVMVATSAFGMGIDIPDIRAVMHVGSPRTMLDYAQESGRAGRDGGPSQAIIVRMEDEQGDRRDREMEATSGRMEVERRLMERYMTGGRCRRIGLDEYLDGRLDRERCEEGEEKCDWCGGDDRSEDEEDGEEGSKDGEEGSEDEESDSERADAVFERQEMERMGIRQRRREEQRQLGQELKEMEGMLMECQDRCASCMLAGREDGKHRLWQCGHIEGQALMKEYRRFRGQLRRDRVMEKFSGCGWCLVPQAWCDRWERVEDEGEMYAERKGRRCQFDEVVMSMYVGFRRGVEGFAEEMDERVRGRFPEEGRGVEEKRWKYVGERMMWGEMETNRLLWEIWQGWRKWQTREKRDESND